MSRFPFRPPEKLSLEGLQSEIGSLIGRWWHCGLSTGPLDGQDWAPPVELREEPGAYHLTIELPGVDRSALEVTAQPGGVVVCGEKGQRAMPTSDEDTETPTARILQSERRYGSFRRTITLPGPIRTDGVSATLADGVLEVILPKAPGATPDGLHVEVRTGQEQADP